MTMEMVDPVTGVVHEGAATAVAQRAEIDVQISTAKAFPRSMKKFMEEVEHWSTLTEEIADECLYAIPRDDKTIEGPSARFGEIVASCWGNCRVISRIMEIGTDQVVAAATFHDLERNFVIGSEVRRRIVNKYGRRYSEDMIVTTANAAASIARRNAIFAGVPKAFWTAAFSKVRATVAGDSTSLAQRRDKAMAYLMKLGALPDRILGRLRRPDGSPIAAVEEITGDHLVQLRGLAQAIKQEETTVDEAFPAPLPPDGAQASANAPAGSRGLEGLKTALDQKTTASVAPSAITIFPGAAVATPESEAQG